jgi:hypothetical protein
MSATPSSVSRPKAVYGGRARVGRYLTRLPNRPIRQPRPNVG